MSTSDTGCAATRNSPLRASSRGRRTGREPDPVVVNHGIREQLPAHVLDDGLCLLPGALREVNLEHLDRSDAPDGRETEKLESFQDVVTLRVRDALLKVNLDAGPHDRPIGRIYLRDSRRMSPRSRP